MSKVYLVTRGSYSDYSVMSVCSTPEKAEIVKSAIEESRIEIYEMDKLADLLEQGYKMYSVEMTRAGITVKIEVEDIEYGNQGHLINYVGNLYVYCWAKDENHAVKIANEKRAQLIAQNEI